MQEAWLETLRSKGYKLTPQRRKIVAVLRGSDKRLTARDIHEQIIEEQPGVSLDTVYRNLRLLVELGVVHQIPLSSGTVYESAGIKDHHHHLICIDCDEVVCIPYCPTVYEDYCRQAEARGFRVLGHSFEIYGRCPNCKNKHEK